MRLRTVMSHLAAACVLWLFSGTTAPAQDNRNEYTNPPCIGDQVLDCGFRWERRDDNWMKVFLKVRVGGQELPPYLIRSTDFSPEERPFDFRGCLKSNPDRSFCDKSMADWRAAREDRGEIWEISWERSRKPGGGLGPERPYVVFWRKLTLPNGGCISSLMAIDSYSVETVSTVKKPDPQ